MTLTLSLSVSANLYWRRLISENNKVVKFLRSTCMDPMENHKSIFIQPAFSVVCGPLCWLGIVEGYLRNIWSLSTDPLSPFCEISWRPDFPDSHMDVINRGYYSFELNTKYISLSVLKSSECSRVRSTREYSRGFNSRDEIYLVFTKKSKFSFAFILFIGRRCWKCKNDIFLANPNDFGTTIFVKMHIHTGCFAHK